MLINTALGARVLLLASCLHHFQGLPTPHVLSLSHAAAWTFPLLPPSCNINPHKLSCFARGNWQVQNYFPSLCPRGQAWEQQRVVLSAKPCWDAEA